MRSLSNESADVVICGAGIAGLAAAYQLAARHNLRRVVLIDEREPLTLTSDKGTQGYRNWWPGPDDTMLRLVSRSIDLLEEVAAESANAFRLNRRGYLFVTADDAQVTRLAATAREVSAFGMGPLRTHPGDGRYVAAPPDGYAGQPIGADLLLGDEALAAFPDLAPDTKAALHIRRAGWMNAVSLGAWLLKRALGSGVHLVRDRVSGVRTDGGRVREVHLASGDTIGTERFVIAAGPELAHVGRLLGVDLPVVHELHAKMMFRDSLRAVRRDTPFMIWTDPVEVDGAVLPGGPHVRPVDLAHGDELYLIWTFESDVRPYAWPPSFDPRYSDIVLRGCARMVPALAAYVAEGARGVVDGGYYCKTRENRPLIGPLPVTGAYVLGALSGFGVMAALASAELLALHVTEQPLPEHARWFLPSRYDDPEYSALVEQWGPLMGQL
jgi:glycine/D-amino acid oxidase-like deaminating enzyme